MAKKKSATKTSPKKVIQTTNVDTDKKSVSTKKAVFKNTQSKDSNTAKKNNKKVTTTKVKPTAKLKTKAPKVKTVVAEIVDDDTPIYESHDMDLDSLDLQATDETYTSPSKSNEFESAKYVNTENIKDVNTSSGHESSLLPTEITSTVPVRSQDLLSVYLNEIRKYPLLSKEEEQRLTKKYFETKDPIVGELLVKSNLRFVVKIAAEYAKFSNRMIDLIQEGNVGLMHAVKEYNPYKGARLITYAVWWIRGYIQEYLMRQFSMVRIGTTANQRKLFYQLQRQKEELEKLASPENILQISKDLNIPEDEVEEMVKRISGRDVSIDKSVNDDDDSVTLGSLLKKPDSSIPLDEQLALNEQINLLKEAISSISDTLSEKEKIILDERLLNEEPLTLQEIGEKYKISREAVRQNEVRLINKIKQALQSKT